MGDFEAELPLYLKSLSLAKFVTNPNNTRVDQYKNVPQAIEFLWIDFYERGYIELEDVTNIQKWLQVLRDIGYKFPSLNSKKSSRSYVESDFEMSNENMFVDDSIISTSYQLSKDFLME